MKRKGTYVLFITLGAAVETEVGALGIIRFDPGTYAYVGSAMGGLDQRLSRHLRKDKAIRWHIDRLTIVADSMEAYESFPDPVPECELARMAAECGMAPAVKGFGCSDCGCPTHLFRVEGPSKDALVARAGLRRFDPPAGE
jgi:Uri superfamily endonuclease